MIDGREATRKESPYYARKARNEQRGEILLPTVGGEAVCAFAQYKVREILGVFPDSVALWDYDDNGEQVVTAEDFVEHWLVIS